MSLWLFEFQENITFLMKKLTQFEKTGLLGTVFIPLGNVKIKFHFRNYQLITFFVSFTLFWFDSGVCLFFKKVNELNLKRNQNSNREKYL